MKILYLCADPGVPIRGHKGAAVHVRALSNAFCSLGHSVTLLTPRPGPADGPQTQAHLIEVATPEKPANLSAEGNEQAALATADSVYRAAKGLLSREPFDVIYERYSLWSEAGARLAAETGLPYVVEINAPLRQEAARYRSLVNSDLAAEIEGNVIHAATALVVVSEPLRAYLLEQGASPESIHVIPNAVDETIFHPAVDGSALRARLGLADKFVVGFVGTSRPWHDLETLIAAMSQLASNRPSLPDTETMGRAPYHLLLVGEISDAVRAAIAAYGLNDSTTIAGPVPNSEIPSWLAAMDVAVSPHPQLPGFYFSPLKLFEYLACGTATVAADVAPITQVLTSGLHALLYSPGDASDLASRIKSLARDPSLRASLGFQGARHVLLHHTWKQNAQTILGLIGHSHGAEQPQACTQENAEPMPIWDEKIGMPLYRATRLDLASEAFSRHLAPREDMGGIRLTGWKALKYKAGRRCVIAYEAANRDSDGSAATMIGKVFRDQRGKEYFKMQRRLWASNFSAEAVDHISVAEPIAYIPELHMFLQACAPGWPLDHFLDAPDLEQQAGLAAATIAKLHESGLKPRSTYSLDSELANLEGWWAGLSALRPDYASTFRLQLACLHRLARDVPAVNAVPVHRDFHYGQLLFSDNTVTLIDLDLLALADPAIDVANFAAHLQFLAIQFRQDPHDLDAVKDAFVQAYLHRRPLIAAAQRLAFYEAATFFRLMYVALIRPPFTPFFEPLLQAANERMQLLAHTL